MLDSQDVGIWSCLFMHVTYWSAENNFHESSYQVFNSLFDAGYEN